MNQNFDNFHELNGIFYDFLLKLNFKIKFWALGTSVSENERLNSTSSAAYGISVLRASKKRVIG